MKPSDAAKFNKGMQAWLIPTSKDGKDAWDIELIDNTTPLPNPRQVAPKAVDLPAQYRIAEDRKQQIATYVNEMARLLAYCRSAAQQSLGEVDEETIRTSTASLFVATQRKFNL